MAEAAEGVVSEGAVGDAEPFSVGEEGLTQGETGEAASGPTEEPELYTVKVGGREERVSLEEALNGYQRQADYTRKAQEVAQQREQVAQMFALQAALERDPRTTVAALASALGVDLGQTQSAQGVQGDDADPFEILARKVDALTNTFTAQQQAASAAQQQAVVQANLQRQIEGELAELESVHGPFERNSLIQYAVDHQTPNLDVAFRAWQFEQQETQKIVERNRATAAKRQAQVVNGGQGTGGAGAVAPGSIGAKPTVREAVMAALAKHQ